jgi:hypothetical protein
LGKKGGGRKNVSSSTGIRVRPLERRNGSLITRSDLSGNKSIGFFRGTALSRCGRPKLDRVVLIGRCNPENGRRGSFLISSSALPYCPSADTTDFEDSRVLNDPAVF